MTDNVFRIDPTRRRRGALWRSLSRLGLLGLTSAIGMIGCAEDSTGPGDQKKDDVIVTPSGQAVAISVVTSQGYYTIDQQGGEDGVPDTTLFRDVQLRNTGTGVLNIHHVASGGTLFRGVDTVGSAVVERSVSLSPGESKAIKLRLTVDKPRIYDGYSLTLGCFYYVPNSPDNGYKIVITPKRALEVPN